MVSVRKKAIVTCLAVVGTLLTSHLALADRYLSFDRAPAGGYYDRYIRQNQRGPVEPTASREFVRRKEAERRPAPQRTERYVAPTILLIPERDRRIHSSFHSGGGVGVHRGHHNRIDARFDW